MEEEPWEQERAGGQRADSSQHTQARIRKLTDLFMTLFVNILYPFLKDKTLIDSKQHPFVFRMKETRACVWKNGRGHTLSMPPPHRCLPLALPCICSPSQPRLCNNSYSFVGTRGQLPVGASHVSISPRPVGVQTGGGDRTVMHRADAVDEDAHRPGLRGCFGSPLPGLAQPLLQACTETACASPWLLF